MLGIFDWSFGTNAGFVELIAGSGSAPNIVPELVTFVITLKGCPTWLLRWPSAHLRSLATDVRVGTISLPQELLASFTAVT